MQVPLTGHGTLDILKGLGQSSLLSFESQVGGSEREMTPKAMQL